MTEATGVSRLGLLACEEGCDPIEDRLGTTLHSTIEAVCNEELAAFLGRMTYSRLQGGVKGHRHGRRERQLTTTLGTETVSVPRARLPTPSSSTTGSSAAASQPGPSSPVPRPFPCSSGHCRHPRRSRWARWMVGHTSATPSGPSPSTWLPDSATITLLGECPSANFCPLRDTSAASQRQQREQPTAQHHPSGRCLHSWTALVSLPNAPRLLQAETN